jgi:hypothetical protein
VRIPCGSSAQTSRPRQLPIPAHFLQRDTEYKAEVLAIEASGDQTLTEVAFMVQ